MRYNPVMQRAFSLVELSIVLVILGLLTGGILAGQSLIRASEIRAVSSEFQRYYTAIYTFRDKYFGLPGDIRNGTAFWGRLSTTDCRTNSSAAVNTATGTCDGDTNSRLVHDAYSSEAFQFWRQLANAGLIEGSYTGLPGPGGIYDGVAGTNAPASRLGGVPWYIDYFDNSANAQTYTFNVNFKNAFRFGADGGGGAGAGNQPILKPEEAWNVDTKVDDGRPTTGRLVINQWNNNCTIPNTGVASRTNLDVSYGLSESAVLCAFLYLTD